MVIIGALIAAGDESIDFLQMLCRVNEYGCDIKPVNHKYLAIPIAGVKHPSELDGLFFHMTSSKAAHPNMPSLAMNVNGQLKVYFLLSTGVQIPARPFMQVAVEQRKNDIVKIASNAVSRIYNGEHVDPKVVYSKVGYLLTLQVKKNILTKLSPPDKPLTIHNKGREDPLVDTGTMLNSISWKVI